MCRGRPTGLSADSVRSCAWEIESDVKTAWLAEQKTLGWEKAYKEMRAKYTVLLPRPPENTNAVPPPAGKTSAAVSTSSNGIAE